jgi:hypothetical protein
MVKGAPFEQQRPLKAIRPTPIFNTTAITPKTQNFRVRIQQLRLGQQILP